MYNSTYCRPTIQYYYHVSIKTFQIYQRCHKNKYINESNRSKGGINLNEKMVRDNVKIDSSIFDCEISVII